MKKPIILLPIAKYLDQLQRATRRSSHLEVADDQAKLQIGFQTKRTIYRMRIQEIHRRSSMKDPTKAIFDLRKYSGWARAMAKNFNDAIIEEHERLWLK